MTYEYNGAPTVSTLVTKIDDGPDAFDHCTSIEHEDGLIAALDDLHCHSFITGDPDTHSPGEGCYECSREVPGVCASCHDDLPGLNDGAKGE